MQSFSTLALVQFGLVGVGLIFQVVAMSWLYHDSSHEDSDAKPANWREKKIDLGNRKGPMVGGATLPRRDSKNDYYEMEKTPPGVRPADLTKTARVVYMDNLGPRPPKGA